MDRDDKFYIDYQLSSNREIDLIKIYQLSNEINIVDFSIMYQLIIIWKIIDLDNDM